MSEEFPIFKYHPNPLETKNITESTVKCICCERNRGFIYVASVYSSKAYDDVICPWCIADGRAAKKLDATFCSDIVGEIAAEIRDEINRRTPGYISWQGEQWQTHCGDACEFHGDVSKSEMNNLEEQAVIKLRSELSLEENEWPEFIKGYEPGSDPAFYKFVCRHCKKVIYYTDFS